MNDPVSSPVRSTGGPGGGPGNDDGKGQRDPEEEFLPELLAAPFGPRGLSLQARCPLSGVQASALDPGEVRVAFAAQALDARQYARLGSRGELEPQPDHAGRLVLHTSHAGLVELVREDPGLAPLLAAHRLATAPPAPVEVMGIVNVTPDSFSDGGRCLGPQDAISHGLDLLRAGADLLDIGAESTRPGARPVPEREELSRVLPVLEGLMARAEARLSIDTQKAGVARHALEAGAQLVNDISAGTADPELLGVTARHDAGLVLMHMRGTPRTMQVAPSYADVVHEVIEHLRQRCAAAWRAGVALPKILVDPGIGFGKELEHNLALIQGLPELRSLGRPILLGVSRKSFLGHLGGIANPPERLLDTAAAVTTGILLGAEIVRVHAVEDLLPAIRVASALARPNCGTPANLDPFGAASPTLPPQSQTSR